VEIAFSSRILRSLCEDDKKAAQKLGSEVAKTLQSRLADLRAASSVSELILGDAKLTCDGKEMTITIGHGQTFAIRCNHSEPPTAAKGQIDWGLVERVKVVRVCDHE
jgi:hypothetical protein